MIVFDVLSEYTVTADLLHLDPVIAWHLRQKSVASRDSGWYISRHVLFLGGFVARVIQAWSFNCLARELYARLPQLPHPSRPSGFQSSRANRAHPSHGSLPLIHSLPNYPRYIGTSSARSPTAHLFSCDTRPAHPATLAVRISRALLEHPPLRPTLATAAMGFGDFSSICERTPLPLCPLVGAKSAITGSHFTQSQCYSRSIELANTIIFQGAAGFAHIIALIMLVIMIIHVRSKFTAVGTCFRETRGQGQGAWATEWLECDLGEHG
jgi:hypothetical protein